MTARTHLHLHSPGHPHPHAHPHLPLGAYPAEHPYAVDWLLVAAATLAGLLLWYLNS